MIRHDLERVTFAEFESYGDFANYNAQHAKELAKLGNQYTGSWTDGETWETAHCKTIQGDLSRVALAEKLLDQIAEVSDGVPPSEWEPSPFGAYPIVPDYLAGRPTPMRMRRETQDPSPVKIIISTTCSAGITAEQMMKRGAAALALLMKLVQIRPATMSILVEGADDKRHTNFMSIIPIESCPLSLCHAAFALGNVGFARAITYPIISHVSGTWYGCWGRDYHSSEYESIVRGTLGMSPEDLWCRSVYYGDPMIDNPVKWVNDQLAKYARVNDGEELEFEEHKLVRC